MFSQSLLKPRHCSGHWVTKRNRYRCCSQRGCDRDQRKVPCWTERGLAKASEAGASQARSFLELHITTGYSPTCYHWALNGENLCFTLSLTSHFHGMNSQGMSMYDLRHPHSLTALGELYTWDCPTNKGWDSAGRKKKTTCQAALMMLVVAFYNYAEQRGDGSLVTWAYSAVLVAKFT